MELLRSRPGTLRVDFGEALDAAPTVSVTDANGDAVAGIGAPQADIGGVYTASVPGLAALGELKAVWSGLLDGAAISQTTFHQVAGSLLFTVSDARTRTMTGAQTPLSSVPDYPDHRIEAMRLQIVHQFERLTGEGWTRRYCRGVVCGSGSRWLSLRDVRPRRSDGSPLDRPGRLSKVASVVSATVDGSDVTGDVVVDGSKLFLTSGVWPAGSSDDPFNVTVEWEYGPEPADPEAHDHGLSMLVQNLVPSDVSGYAQSFSGEDGRVEFGPGGLAYPSRVWAWLKGNKPIAIA